MRVVILHYAAPPIVGGVERVIYYHATLLADAGYDVHVVAGRGETFSPHVTFHRVEWVDSRHPEVLAQKSELDRGRVPDQFEALVTRIGDSLQDVVSRHDILIAHNVLSLHKNLALTAALYRLTLEQNGPRLIAWHHDLAWKAARYLSELHDGYPWDLIRQDWPGVCHVTVSESRRRDVAGLLGVLLEEVAVVPNGVDVTAFLKVHPAIQHLFGQSGLVDTEPWLLLPARVTRRKNIELALRVTAALRAKTFPRAVLIITGPPGPHNPENQHYFAQLNRLRQDLTLDSAVQFLAERMEGGPSDEMMISLYQLADALILPSHEEGFGIPILEAALARLPIFCSDIAPLRELAGDRAHYFSPTADPEDVADMIGHVLLADRATLLRRQVLNRHNWRDIVHDYVVPLLKA